MALDHDEPADGGSRRGGVGDVERGGGGSNDIERGGGASAEGNSQQNADMAADDLTPAADDPAHPDREDERLDEALEETFPASDPVSAKHIT